MSTDQHDLTTPMTAPAVEGPAARRGLSRRTALRVGAAGTAAAGVAAARIAAAPDLAARGLLSPQGVLGAASIAWSDSVYIEAFPTSPLILTPFSDPLPIPKAKRPEADWKSWAQTPGPGNGQQNSLGNEKHQIWP